MPGRDRTGPLGRGPYTGRRSNDGGQEYKNTRPCFGRRQGTIDNNRESLDAEKKALEERIKYINSQLEKQ